MKKLLTIIGLAAASLAGTNAAVVINYNPVISALPSGQPASITANGTNIDSAIVQDSTLSRGVGITTGGATAGRFNGSSVSTTSLANALSGNDYFTFNVTPAALVTLNFESVSFSLQSSASGGANYGFFSSIQGFAEVNVIQQGALTLSGTTSVTISSATLGASFDAVTTATEFRIYVWGASSASGTSSVNTLQVAAVPEPKTWALIGIGSSFMLWNLRRRRRFNS